MIKREIKRNVRKYGMLFEPLLVLFLIIIIVGPLLIVINLTPQPSAPSLSEDDVLGVSDEKIPNIILVGGTHQYINDERIAKNNDLQYEYYFTLLRRDKGIYNKPVLQVSNPSDEPITIQMNMTQNEPSKTHITFSLEDTIKSIKRSDGSKKIIEFILQPQEVVILNLDAISAVTTNFNESYRISIIILGWENPNTTILEEVSDETIQDVDPAEEFTTPTDQLDLDQQIDVDNTEYQDEVEVTDPNEYPPADEETPLPTNPEEELPSGSE